MVKQKLENSELGLSFDYWRSSQKNERVFLAKQITKQLGYKGTLSDLKKAELEEGKDMVKVTKKAAPKFFEQLGGMNLVGQRASSVVMLYESGVWKLIMGSKKQIGIKTRNWLAREVLPSIREKGYYDVSESESNPFSYLHDFTEETKQKSNSKEVARKTQLSSQQYSKVFNEIHKLTIGKTAKEIQEMFKSKESARQLLRKNFPEMACTEAVIDELYARYNKSLEEIEKSDAHRTLPPAFKSLYELGIKFFPNE